MEKSDVGKPWRVLTWSVKLMSTGEENVLKKSGLEGGEVKLLYGVRFYWKKKWSVVLDSGGVQLWKDQVEEDLVEERNAK